MPRTPRRPAGGVVYHVLNRGNGRMGIFRKAGDYAAFLDVLLEAKDKASVELFGYCLMPNHWHLVLRPRSGKDLPAFLSWLTNTHVKRYRSHYKRTSGHLYQGRYKSFPVKDDGYFLTLLRYVESNPLRAKTKLVRRARDWKWSSLGCDGKLASELLSPWPVPRPRNWAEVVDQALPESERALVKASLERGRPLGDDRWVRDTARQLGLQPTLNPRGRPAKRKEK